MPKQTSPVKKFNPADLSQEERNLVLEYELGVHPKYHVYTASQISVNLWTLEHDGGRFDGWLPYRKQVGTA